MSDRITNAVLTVLIEKEDEALELSREFRAEYRSRAYRLAQRKKKGGTRPPTQED